MEREKKHDDFIKKFRKAIPDPVRGRNKPDNECDQADKLPIEDGELEWMVIDNCWDVRWDREGLVLGKSYYVDEDTYNEELADCMERNAYSKEDVLLKQDFLINLPALLANITDEEVKTSSSTIEAMKEKRNELKGLLKLLKK